MDLAGQDESPPVSVDERPPCSQRVANEPSAAVVAVPQHDREVAAQPFQGSVALAFPSVGHDGLVRLPGRQPVTFPQPSELVYVPVDQADDTVALRRRGTRPGDRERSLLKRACRQVAQRSLQALRRGCIPIAHPGGPGTDQAAPSDSRRARSSAIPAQPAPSGTSTE